MSTSKENYFISEWPNEAGECFTYFDRAEDRDGIDSNGLPLPPRRIRQYGEAAGQHAQSGRRDAQLIFDLAREFGHHFENTLEFASGSGRVIRWFAPHAGSGEIWGVDIDAPRVMWCNTHLKPLHFCTMTTAAHLPFEDRFFTFIYGYSIFTHLDESYLAWVQELRRVLAIGGYLFITLHDEQAVEIGRSITGLMQKHAASPGFSFDRPDATYEFYKAESGWLNTCIKSDYFLSNAKRYFDCKKIVSKTIGNFQTGILLRRRV